MHISVTDQMECLDEREESAMEYLHLPLCMTYANPPFCGRSKTNPSVGLQPWNIQEKHLTWQTHTAENRNSYTKESQRMAGSGSKDCGRIRLSRAEFYFSLGIVKISRGHLLHHHALPCTNSSFIPMHLAAAPVQGHLVLYSHSIPSERLVLKRESNGRLESLFLFKLSVYLLSLERW